MSHKGAHQRKKWFQKPASISERSCLAFHINYVHSSDLPSKIKVELNRQEELDRGSSCSIFLAKYHWWGVCLNANTKIRFVCIWCERTFSQSCPKLKAFGILLRECRGSRQSCKWRPLLNGLILSPVHHTVGMNNLLLPLHKDTDFNVFKKKQN